MTEIILAISDGSLIITAILAVVAATLLGMGMPTPIAYLLLAMFAAPALITAGVPKLGTHLFLFYFAIKSGSTPPIALVAMVAAGITKANLMIDEKYPHTVAQKATGDWNPMWDLFREQDPVFLEAFLAFRSVPQHNGPLKQKYKELIFIAINATTTHLHGPGVRRHMQNALRAGATNEEILEVIQLTTIMGIHSMSLAAPILQEEVTKLEGYLSPSHCSKDSRI